MQKTLEKQAQEEKENVSENSVDVSSTNTTKQEKGDNHKGMV